MKPYFRELHFIPDIPELADVNAVIQAELPDT